MQQPIPTTPRKCWARWVLRVIGRILFCYAILLLLATALVAPLGGPFEPPSDMSWDEFLEWTSSGAWWKESVGLSAIVGGVGVGLMFIGKKRSSNTLSKATR